ncbi:hypothetical protein MPSEU_000326200 [Mayamaea pseudoterrestris]|nr:hypothetical protein MPSEU_000326200 [Mayamaea pseudoterrestris]
MRLSQLHCCLSPKHVLPLVFVFAWMTLLYDQVDRHSRFMENTALIISMKDFASNPTMSSSLNHGAVAGIDKEAAIEQQSSVRHHQQQADARHHRRRRRQRRNYSNTTNLRRDFMPDMLPDYAKRANYEHLPLRIPPLDSLIHTSNFISPTNYTVTFDKNVSYLLDFAIIGFGKCGTSTLMHWLNDHDESQVLGVEMWSLVANRPAFLVARLHRSLQQSHQKQRGYKCPGDVLQPHAMRYYHTLWPRAKLFVGVRHPILHFESLYNFRIQNFVDSQMKHPNRLIGPCYGGYKMTCTLKSDWAYYLLALGKQFLQIDGSSNATSYELSELEREIVYHHPYRRKPMNISTIQPIRNKIFIFELGQLGDANETRRQQFQSDVQQYLGFKAPLAPVHHFVPGKVWPAPVQAAKNELKMNVCDHDYIPLRRELLRQARLSANWVETVFLNAHGVHASNREHLHKLLDTWRSDPCGPDSEKVTEEESIAILLRTRDAPDSARKKELLEFLKLHTPVENDNR